MLAHAEALVSRKHLNIFLLVGRREEIRVLFCSYSQLCFICWTVFVTTHKFSAFPLLILPSILLGQKWGVMGWVHSSCLGSTQPSKKLNFYPSKKLNRALCSHKAPTQRHTSVSYNILYFQESHWTFCIETISLLCFETVNSRTPKARQIFWRL